MGEWVILCTVIPIIATTKTTTSSSSSSLDSRSFYPYSIKNHSSWLRTPNRTTQYACIYFNLLFIYAYGKVDNSVAKRHTNTHSFYHLSYQNTSPLNSAKLGSDVYVMLLSVRKNQLFGYDYFHRCVYASLYWCSPLWLCRTVGFVYEFFFLYFYSIRCFASLRNNHFT